MERQFFLVTRRTKRDLVVLDLEYGVDLEAPRGFLKARERRAFTSATKQLLARNLLGVKEQGNFSRDLWVSVLLDLAPAR